MYLFKEGKPNFSLKIEKDVDEEQIFHGIHVSVQKLIVKGTIEEKIVKMQESKKELADAILNGENGSITQMSKEELMELLEGEEGKM